MYETSAFWEKSGESQPFVSKKMVNNVLQSPNQNLAREISIVKELFSRITVLIPKKDELGGKVRMTAYPKIHKK